MSSISHTRLNLIVSALIAVLSISFRNADEWITLGAARHDLTNDDSPLPNDQSSRPVPTRLMKTSSRRIFSADSARRRTCL